MSNTADFLATIDTFRKTTETKLILAPQVLALALWEALVDATPVLSGLTRANWRFGVNGQQPGPAVLLTETEYDYRQKHDDPLPRPDSPAPGLPNAGDVYYISNSTVDPRGYQYLFRIIYGTPSQPRPWFDLTLEEVKFRAPELLRATAYTEKLSLVSTTP